MDLIDNSTSLLVEDKTKHIEPPFFPVSVRKLAIMSVATLTLYQFYWCYKNWSYIKNHSDLKISPALRALFQPFFCIQLFICVYKHQLSEDKNISTAILLAILWILANFMFFLSSPYYLLGYLMIFYPLPIQATINVINSKATSGYDVNDNLSSLNWIMIIIGVPIFILNIVGVFLPS